MAQTAVCNHHHSIDKQKSGVIKYSRGHITVWTGQKLEALSCECYGVVTRESDRLLLRRTP